MGTYSPFFTFFEDLSYFIKRNIVLVRYLEQKEESLCKARRLLVLSPTYCCTERNNKRSADQNSCSALSGQHQIQSTRISPEMRTPPLQFANFTAKNVNVLSPATDFSSGNPPPTQQKAHTETETGNKRSAPSLGCLQHIENHF